MGSAQKFENKPNSNIESYEFAEFEGSLDESGKVRDYEIKDFREIQVQEEKKLQPTIKSERSFAKQRQFNISPVVEHYRGLKDQEEREYEERISKEVLVKLAEYKQKAYDEGYAKGQEKGYQEVKESLEEESKEKIAELEGYIKNTHNQRLELLKHEKAQIYEVVRTLTKWVILRELEDDGAYLERLLEKLILEVQEKSNLLLRVNKDYFERMPDVIEMVESKIGELTNTRVELLSESDFDFEKGLILESESGVINGTLKEQLDNIDKLFSSLDAFES